MNVLARSLLTTTLAAGLSFGITTAADASTPAMHTIATGSASLNASTWADSAVVRPDYPSWHWAQHIANRDTCEAEKAIFSLLEPVMGCFDGGGMGWEFAYWD